MLLDRFQWHDDVYDDVLLFYSDLPQIPDILIHRECYAIVHDFTNDRQERRCNEGLAPPHSPENL